MLRTQGDFFSESIYCRNILFPLFYNKPGLKVGHQLDSLYFIYQVCKDTQKISLKGMEVLILREIKFIIYFAGVMENFITFRNIFQVGRQRF